MMTTVGLASTTALVVSLLLAPAQGALLAPVSTRAAAAALPRSRACIAKFIDADGNEIKGALSSYMHFCNERRPSLTTELKATHGDAFKQPLVMSTLGAEWKALGEGVKAKYVEAAAADKARYDAAVASNPANAGVKKTSKRKVTKSKKLDADGNEIKAALSSYMHFCNERRPSLTTELKAKHGDAFKQALVMSTLGAEWKALGDVQKTKFAEAAAADKARYDAAVAAA